MSLLVAGIPMLVFTFEYFFAVKLMGNAIPSAKYHHLLMLSLGFSGAVFLVYLAHEITKDIRDLMYGTELDMICMDCLQKTKYRKN